MHYNATSVTVIVVLLTQILPQIYTENRFILFKSVTHKVARQLQQELVRRARSRCMETLRRIQLAEAPQTTLANQSCGPQWDGASCWPHSQSINSSTRQLCPNYIDKFRADGYMTRFCLEVPKKVGFTSNDSRARSYTNYAGCYARQDPFAQTLVRIMYTGGNVGHWSSLASLLIAIFFLRKLKRIQCDRNTIHLNLFLACLFRSAFQICATFISNDSDWKSNVLCKMFSSLSNYSILANYSWICVEAVFLHNILLVHTFNSSSSSHRRVLRLYIFLGWTAPLIVIFIWILLKLNYDKGATCWNSRTSNDPKMRSRWLLIAYPTVLTLTNALLFVNLVRLLHSKLKSQQISMETKTRFRKLAKSIFVLMFSFGLYQLLFIPIDILQIANQPQPVHTSKWLLLTKIFLEYLIISFQGVFVSVLFCFANSEIYRELKRKFHVFLLNRRRRTNLGTLRSSRLCPNSVSATTLRPNTAVAVSTPAAPIRMKNRLLANSDSVNSNSDKQINLIPTKKLFNSVR